MSNKPKTIEEAHLLLNKEQYAIRLSMKECELLMDLISERIKFIGADLPAQIDEAERKKGYIDSLQVLYQKASNPDQI